MNLKKGNTNMPEFKVFRYNPRKGEVASFQTYELPETKSMTVLEGLYYIIENLDPTLAFRSSCRSEQKRCGSAAAPVLFATNRCVSQWR